MNGWLLGWGSASYHSTFFMEYRARMRTDWDGELVGEDGIWVGDGWCK